MRRSFLIVAEVMIVLTVACSSGTKVSPPSGLPACLFEIGDTVIRGEIGAEVPPLGESVTGDADSPEGSSSISITTSKNGVVTINSTKDGVEAPEERCALR